MHHYAPVRTIESARCGLKRESARDGVSAERRLDGSVTCALACSCSRCRSGCRTLLTVSTTVCSRVTVSTRDATTRTRAYDARRSSCHARGLWRASASCCTRSARPNAHVRPGRNSDVREPQSVGLSSGASSWSSTRRCTCSGCCSCVARCSFRRARSWFTGSWLRGPSRPAT